LDPARESPPKIWTLNANIKMRMIRGMSTLQIEILLSGGSLGTFFSEVDAKAE